jgi:3-dehydroquinate synthase
MHAEPPEQVGIDLAERSYEILIGTRIFDAPQSYVGLGHGGAAVVVSNTTVAPLWAERLMAALRAQYPRVLLVTLPDGEEHKTWTTLNLIFDALLQAGCDRATTLFALGGGVVGDLTGFAAACFMRGVAFVQVPTTLLAQVDSSVGGKTAVNHPLGKNMIGVFHQPLRVVADLDVLDTLPEREFNAGLAEVIKYGPIADDAFLGWIEVNLPALCARDKPALRHAVKRSCEIKAAIVARDEREADMRAVLNFGHSFGHAIETGLGYGQWLHGEAVGCGMVMAADLSARLGLVDAGYARRVRDLVQRAGLPVVGPRLGPLRYLELMRVDKKARAGEIRFVVIESPGRAGVRSAPDALVTQVLEANTA